MVDKSKVFLSYSRRDLQIATALTKDLEALGVNVWMDRHDISIGERWSAAIQKALEDSYAMVLVLSPDSMSSPNVEDEFTYFLDNHKPIVPVMVRPTKVHYQLHRMQWIDFTEGATDRAYHDLIEALQAVGVEFGAANPATDDPLIARLIDDLQNQKIRSRRRKVMIGSVGGALAILLMIALLALVFSSGNGNNLVEASPSPRPFIVGVTNNPNVRLYEEPSRDSREVRVFDEVETVLPISQRTPDGRFLFVKLFNIEGWVFAGDVTISSEGSISEIAVFVSPTPSPTLSPTPLMTATPTPTASPTPEIIGTEVNIAENCVVSMPLGASPEPVYYGPSRAQFSEYDTFYPEESFVAMARSGTEWLYLSIGWVQRGIDIMPVDAAICDSLPEDPNLRPIRLRRYLKDLPLIGELRDNAASGRPIDISGMTSPQLEVAQAWNRYESLIAELAALLNIQDKSLLLALIVEEANLQGGSTGDNLMEIRFEADITRPYLTKAQQVEYDIHFRFNPASPDQHQFRAEKVDPWVYYHGDVALEWQAFQTAYAINPDAAIRGLRFGDNGILGDNFYLLGYNTPQEMYKAYLSDPVARVLGKLDYVKSREGAVEALRNQDWAAFATAFNGDSDRVGLAVANEISTYLGILQMLAGGV